MSESYSHTIIPKRKIIIQRFRGSLSLASVCEGTEKLWADPQYDRSYDGISDLSHSVARGSVEDVRALVQFVGKRSQTSTGRWVVVTNDPMITAFALLFARLSSKPTLTVFSTWTAATAFLQVEIPPS